MASQPKVAFSPAGPPRPKKSPGEVPGPARAGSGDIAVAVAALAKAEPPRHDTVDDASRAGTGGLTGTAQAPGEQTAGLPGQEDAEAPPDAASPCAAAVEESCRVFDAHLRKILVDLRKFLLSVTGAHVQLPPPSQGDRVEGEDGDSIARMTDGPQQTTTMNEVRRLSAGGCKVKNDQAKINLLKEISSARAIVEESLRKTANHHEQLRSTFGDAIRLCRLQASIDLMLDREECNSGVFQDVFEKTLAVCDSAHHIIKDLHVGTDLSAVRAHEKRGLEEIIVSWSGPVDGGGGEVSLSSAAGEAAAADAKSATNGRSDNEGTVITTVSTLNGSETERFLGGPPQLLEAYAGPNRFGEISKLLPVAFVIVTILVVYVEYVYMHCFGLMQFDLPYDYQDTEMVRRGAWQLLHFHVLTGVMLYCFARCILTYPGTIPSNRGWDLNAGKAPTAAVKTGSGDGRLGGAAALGTQPAREAGADAAATRRMSAVDLVEKKHSGARRHCKWCLKYKPDRCHHCRICNLCVLRMDHHCPWVYNCIGFRNHKYFFLLLVYASLDLSFISVTMLESVWWSTRTDVPIFTMVTLGLGELYAIFLWVLTTGFLGFHIWLLSKAMSTVEFCEKSLKKTSYNSSIYSLGAYRNTCAVLGSNPLFWLIPLSPPEGDGLTWSNH